MKHVQPAGMPFDDFRSKKKEKRSFLPYLPLALSFFFHVRAHGRTEPREEKRIERALLLRAGAPPRQRREPPAMPARPPRQHRPLAFAMQSRVPTSEAWWLQQGPQGRRARRPLLRRRRAQQQESRGGRPSPGEAIRGPAHRLGHERAR